MRRSRRLYGSASGPGCRSSSTTRTQACSRADSGGCFGGWGMTRSRVAQRRLPKWRAEDRPVDSGNYARPPQRFTGSPRPEMTLDARGVAAASAIAAGCCWMPARPSATAAICEPIDRVPGHIPGAVNHHFLQNIDEQGVFRSPEDLRARCPPRSAGACEGRRSLLRLRRHGVPNLLAMEVAGLTGAKLYTGSWSEWSSDPSRPVERGDK